MKIASKRGTIQPAAHFPALDQQKKSEGESRVDYNSRVLAFTSARIHAYWELWINVVVTAGSIDSCWSKSRCVCE
ncbi:hypothetical protein UPYG_G00334460 [Umbra pygmaea]|uniref:Uncharacterized protein n=1 Tax=Umbra pygmaea TaxID=75934 RepID=A0ABD0WA91_UMBPY